MNMCKDCVKKYADKFVPGQKVVCDECAEVVTFNPEPMSEKKGAEKE